MKISGEVVEGQGYPEKDPTANVALDAPIEAGNYVGHALLGNEPIGKAAVWVLPHQPNIAEVYVAGFRGDLYGTFLTVEKIQKLSREHLRTLYDKALA